MAPRELSSLICIVCFENYDTDERAPCVASCGHSVCAICYDQIRPKCPTCSNPRSFTRKLKNYQLIAMIGDLQEFLHDSFPELNKKCGNCNKEVSDDEAYTCISCSICVKAASADEFLAKARKNRFCSACENVLKAPHHSGRLTDVQMAVKSKEFANTVEFGNSSNVLLEMDYAVKEAKTSLSMIEKQFPIGKKASGDCSEEKLEELMAVASSSLAKAAETVKEGIAAIYTMAEKLAEVSNSLNELPNVVDFSLQDNKFLAKIKFTEKESSFFDDKMLLELDSKRTFHKWAFNPYNDVGLSDPPYFHSYSAPFGSFPFAHVPSYPQLDRTRCKAETRSLFLKDMIAFFRKK